MTENETVTIASELKRIERLEADLAQANTAQETSISAMTKRQRDAGIDELMTLSDGVRSAKATCDGVQATINTAKRTIVRLEWEAKSAKLTGALNPIASTARLALVAAKAIMAEFKVTGVVITFDKVDTEATIVSVKPTGPDVPKPPTAKRGGGGGGGARTRLSFNGPNGETANTRELFDKFGVEVLGAERAAKIAADPQGQGLTHAVKDRIAPAKGYTVA